MTIFKHTTFDRSISRWEEHLYDLTPVEKIGDIYFKREDKFAPLGFNSINGSKLRQCIWLVDEWVKKKNIRGVVSGSVVGSPQHPFISSICKQYGIGCLIVTGSKNYLSHKNMQLADELGAHFYVTNIGYAKALQSKSFKLAQQLPNHEVLETNITVDERINTPERVEAFHRVGSYQVNNIPEHIENLIIPCGSCNSVTSILYGIAVNKPKNLKRILLMGIGNNGSYHLDYIPRRLKIISSVIGIDLNDCFDYTFLKDRNEKGISVLHYNLNGSGFCSYESWMPFNYDGIELHPRYEGKVFNFMKAKEPFFKPYMNEKTLFWVVGNEPTYIPK
jgi:hypothetical protein